MSPPSNSSESSSSSESDSDTISLAKPKFVRRNKPDEHESAKELQLKQQRESTLDQIKKMEAEVIPTTLFTQSVDDTDGLDPEAEYKAWEQREIRRIERDSTSV